MDKVMIIAMLVGGVLLFFIILIFLVNSVSGPAQAPQLENSQKAVDETESDLIDDAQLQEFDDGSSFGRETGFGGDKNLIDEESGLPTVDGGYKQLPSGELRDDYAASLEDSDNNGFLDFQEESFGF